MFDKLASSPRAVDQVVEILKLIADPTRFRLISLLEHGELNVNTMCQRLELAQPTVSHHLGLLRSGGLVESRRDGKQVFYSLNTEAVGKLNPHGGLSLAAGPVELRLIPGVAEP